MSDAPKGFPIIVIHTCPMCGVEVDMGVTSAVFEAEGRDQPTRMRTSVYYEGLHLCKELEKKILSGQ